MVKCLYCQKEFNRDKEENVKIKNRYAHKDCYDEVLLIHNYIEQKLGLKYSEQKVESQIKEFVQKGIPLNQIHPVLFYWYDIKKNSSEKAYGGIGIVPHIFEEAIKYFEQEEKNKNINKGKDIKSYIPKEEKKVQVKRKPIQKPKNVYLFDLR